MLNIYRQLAGMTFDDVAGNYGDGVTRQNIHNLLTGYTNISEKILIRLILAINSKRVVISEEDAKSLISDYQVERMNYAMSEIKTKTK